MPDASTRSDTYHHGNLRDALVETGYALARVEGVHAVGMRELARRTGVTAAAAYRHFDGLADLQLAIAQRGLADLARSIERAGAHVARDDPDHLLASVGLGYIGFALDDPGGFEAAMFSLATMNDADSPEARGDSGLTAYQLLEQALGALVAAGRLSPTAVDAAAIQCWSGVHGFATLATRGPLRQFPRPAQDALAADLVARIVTAVTA